MMKIKNILRVVAIFSLLSGSAFAAETGRFANLDEIHGYWKMITMTNALDNDPWPMPHQWFAINEDGTFQTIMTSNSSTASKSRLKEIFSSMQEERSQYTFEYGAFLMQHPDRPGQTQLWAINIILKEAVIGPFAFLPGDLLMTLDQDGSAVYFRHLRKVIH